MAAYYNEIDPFAAAWLRELIAAGLIAPGDVDERSIEDVLATDLVGYSQCHFFAGIGGWSHALRLAGWPDDRPVWTGSCPCQPFSAAGVRRGFADRRHLWPEFFRLIRERRPVAVFGEQVGGNGGLAWVDVVFADLEAHGYACGALDFPAASVGAPHIRQRLYWCAVTGASGGGICKRERVGHADREQRHRRGHVGQAGGHELADHGGIVDRLADAHGDRRGARPGHDPALGHGQTPASDRLAGGARPTDGHWRDADWLRCRDDRWRPVEPGLEPLVDGAAARVGRLRGYGNAIVAPQAAAFIETAMSILEDSP